MPFKNREKQLEAQPDFQEYHEQTSMDRNDDPPISEDLVVWMTEPIPWALAPRSNCG